MPIVQSEIEGLPATPRQPAEPRPAEHHEQGAVRSHDFGYLPAGEARLNGVYPAQVVNLLDPHQRGRVQVRLPWAVDPADEAYQVWARLATLMAGDGRGTWFIPELGDEVLVAFEAGNPSRPYVIGALWNGQDAPPENAGAYDQNNRKLIRTRSGLELCFDDSDGQEKLELSTPAGQRLVLQDAPNQVEIHTQDGSKIIIGQAQIDIVSPGKVSIQAGIIELNAGMLTVDASLAKFSGTVQASTLIASAVVASSYTPGAGNIW